METQTRENSKTFAVYLLPSVLSEGVTNCLPAYILEAAKSCSAFFVENERTARRYLKLLSKEIVIDDYEWYTMAKGNDEIIAAFSKVLSEGKTIGIISEAGCPGVADPGQELVRIAHEKGVPVKPLVGPSSILLALMASGMNGQQFQFVGYLPIDIADRAKAIKNLEAQSKQNSSTQIFIETPYRSNQVLETMLKTCSSSTRICIAADLTGGDEFIKTQTVHQWKSAIPQLHKRPVIFLLQSGS